MEEQRAMAELRIRQLELALKECTKQKQKVAEAMEMEMRQKLLEADAQNSAMAKSLQERAKMIAELREGKAMAETEAKLLQAKVEAMAKEISALKYEVHVMSKEADLRHEEKEMNRKASEAAQKQHLEVVKKMGHLEADCNRLRALLKKKLPGPAAIAQIKAEADFISTQSFAIASPSSPSSAIAKQQQQQQQRKKKTSPPSPPPPPPPSPPPAAASSHPAIAEASPHRRDMEFMAERLLCLEEETRRLRDVLACRIDGEAAAGHGHSAAAALAAEEEEQQHKEASPVSERPDFCIQSAEIMSISSEKLRDDDEVSCSESWASALMTELDQFKREKRQKEGAAAASATSAAAISAAAISAAASADPATQSNARLTLNRRRENQATLQILASRDAQLQSANILCKDALFKMDAAAKELSEIHGGAMDSAAFFEAHRIMVKLDRILDDLRIAVASISEDDDEEEEEDDGEGSKAAMAEMEKQVAELVAELADARRSKAEYEESKEAMKKQMEVQVSEAERRAEAADREGRRAEAAAEMAAERAAAAAEMAEVEKTKREEAEVRLRSAAEEIEKLTMAVEELSREVAEHKKENEKLQEFLNRTRSDQDRTSSRFQFKDHQSIGATKKDIQDRDVFAAKEKLSECQRAIMLLEKQLTSLECSGNGCGIMAKDQFVNGGQHSAINGNLQQQHESWNNSYGGHGQGGGCGGGGGGSGIQWQQHQQSQEPMNLSHYHVPPLRIHSDIGYGRGGAPAQSYSVGDYLHMDEERRLSHDDGQSSRIPAAVARHSRRQDPNPRSVTASSVVAQGRSTECKPTSLGSRLFGRSNRKQT